MEPLTVNKKQLLLGASFLLAGTMEYLVARPIESLYLPQKCKAIPLFFHQMPSLYGKLGIFAPEFFHPLALSLLSMTFLSGRKSRTIICSIWLGIDSIFELAQKYPLLLMECIPEWFETVPILENLGSYLRNGRFDLYDLIAITLGSVTAWCVGELTANMRSKVHENVLPA